MVGVARIELATPAMSTQGHWQFSAEKGGFPMFQSANTAGTNHDSAASLPHFYRIGDFIMGAPKDFDRTLWLDPFTFEGLVGAAIADGLYSELFRPDGFAKPIAELAKDKRIAKLIARL